MIKNNTLAVLIILLASPLANAQDQHPIMNSKFWLNAGIYVADRTFEAEAKASVPGISREIDFEGDFGVDDAPNLFMAEFGWQFGKKWGLALQYFQSEREGNGSLNESFEWEDLTFDVGVDISAGTDLSIMRVFFARQFWDGGPHSVRLGAGLHWLEMGAHVEGIATLNDQSTDFRRGSVSVSAPVPNLGVWYRYSPSDRWLFNARLDWLSASVDDYSGGIWNMAAGVNYRIFKHFGAGIAYQYFELDGSVDGDNWHGGVNAVFKGPHIYINGFW